MVISHANRFVIFAPWKTASQTIHARFARFNQSAYDRFYDFNIHLNRIVHQHITCADFAALPESRLGYFLASAVRNPYDRAYSGFLQILEDLRVQPDCNYPTPWIREQVLQQLRENLAQIQAADCTFDGFIRLLREEQVYDIGRNSSFVLHPSHYWTHLAGEQYVHYIMRVESIDEDIARLLPVLGIAEIDHVNANVREPLRESSGEPKYVSRMDRASVDKINALFARDFELFGYDMR
jgi:hypothetical protein